jgi:hypothetical protein
MDMTVMQMGAVVVTEFRTAGYMESTIGQYVKTIEALSEFASERVYSVELGAEFASMTIGPRTGRFSAQRRFDYRRLVEVLDSYVQTGRVNLSAHRPVFSLGTVRSARDVRTHRPADIADALLTQA